MLQNIDNANRDMETLLRHVMEQNSRSVDYQANTGQMEYRTRDTGNGKQTAIFLEGQGGEPTRQLDVNGVCFDGIAKTAEIDVRTARRLSDNYPEQWDGLINAIWQQEPKPRLLRTFMDNERTGTARAMLSDRFKTYDNLDLIETAIPELIKANEEDNAGWQLQNWHSTDKKLMARFKSNTIVGEGAKVGDLMALGLLISNSETGHGSIQVAQINWTLACLNGMQTENKIRSPHLTSSRGDADVWSVLTEEAKKADNAAMSLKLRDMVRAFSSRESFDEILQKMQTAAADVIEGTFTEKAVDKMGSILGIPQKRRSLVLEGLVQTRAQDGYVGEPVSRATLMNAITAVPQMRDASGNPMVQPDDIDDWQRLGGRVLEMKQSDWTAISRASLEAA